MKSAILPQESEHTPSLRSSFGQGNKRMVALVAILGALCTVISPSAHAQTGATSCVPYDAFGDQVCTTSIPVQQFGQTAYMSQQASEWCWAASISMVWAYYGHPVSQSEIVAGELGQVINQPGQAWQIFQALNGQRTDDNGVAFTSRVTGLYDVMDGYDNISYTDIGAALNNGEPVLIGTENPDGSGAHATVLASLQYAVPAGYPVAVAADGSNVMTATVFDPWPTSGGISVLQPPQVLPAGSGGGLFFAAIVSVSTVSTTTTTTQQTSSGGKGGGGSFDLLALLALSIVFVTWRGPRFAGGV